MRFLLVLIGLLIAAPAVAQVPSVNAGVPGAYYPGTGCNAATIYTAQGVRPVTVDANGNLCTSSSGTTTITGNVTPGSLNVQALDVSTVTTGTTAVTALTAGHAIHGGFLVTANIAGICVNVAGGAAGTATSGNTICVPQNVPYTIPPTTNAVSVNSGASSVTFAGNGLD